MESPEFEELLISENEKALKDRATRNLCEGEGKPNTNEVSVITSILSFCRDFKAGNGCSGW